MTCAKCRKTFAENRTVWPSNICKPCRGSMHRCVGLVLSGGRRTRRSEVTIVRCSIRFNGTKLDPFVLHGLEWCILCRRNSCCHHCGALRREVELSGDLCKQCRTWYSFCNKCRSERRGESCVPPSEQVAPVYFDKITFTPLKSIIQSCSNGQKPLFFGTSSHAQTDKIDLNDAHRWASRLFSSLVTFLCQNKSGSRKDAPLPQSQDTMAISLLDNGSEYRIILTYSEYDITHVPTNIKTTHPTFKLLVVPALPKVHYDKEKGKHHIEEKKHHIEEKKHHIEEKSVWRPYPIHHRNDHHAEMRAYRYASQYKYNVLAIKPTKECCDKCQISLEESNLLDIVPFWLRIKQAPRRTMVEQDRGGFLVDEELKRRLKIRAVGGGGDCIFEALHTAGVRTILSVDADNAAHLRRLIAAQLSQGAQGRVGVAGAYVDTHDLAAIARVVGRHIVLYEAYYGATEWHQRTDNWEDVSMDIDDEDDEDEEDEEEEEEDEDVSMDDKDEKKVRMDIDDEDEEEVRPPIIILLRSVRGELEGHYDPVL